MTATSPLAAALLLAVAGLPLALAAALLTARGRAWVPWVAPLAALPAVALAAGAAPDAAAALPSVLLGVHLAVDDALARGFLLFTAILWAIAAWFARSYVGGPHRAGFWGFFLLTMAGNLGVIVAQDVATFYLCFGLLSLASYGLIVHDRTPAAHRAARVYLVLALLGDVLLLAAFALITASATSLELVEVRAALARSPDRALATALLFAGFGVKAGAVVPLHVWLPLAHPVAPAPASALLSGALIKAGLLGWLRFLPLGVVALPAAGLAWIAVGLFAAFAAALVGVTQRDAKATLAYSSISQMGLMMVPLGVALAAPAAAARGQAAVLELAHHHAMSKAALFLGVAVAAAAARRAGPAARRLVALGLIWPALEIAGAPLTSGALAKAALKDAVALAPWAHDAIALLASAAAVGSALLMLRVVALAWPRAAPAGGEAIHGAHAGHAPWRPWAALLAIDAALFVAALASRGAAPLVDGGALASSLWPLALAAALAAVAHRLAARRVRRGRAIPAVPPGDLLALIVGLGRPARRLGDALRALGRDSHERARGVLHAGVGPAIRGLGRAAERAEARLVERPAAGVAFVVLAALLGAAAWLAG